MLNVRRETIRLIRDGEGGGGMEEGGGLKEGESLHIIVMIVFLTQVSRRKQHGRFITSNRVHITANSVLLTQASRWN